MIPFLMASRDGFVILPPILDSGSPYGTAFRHPDLSFQLSDEMKKDGNRSLHKRLTEESDPAANQLPANVSFFWRVTIERGLAEGWKIDQPS